MHKRPHWGVIFVKQMKETCFCTIILLEGMEPSFCKATFKSELELITGSLWTPSAATKIVICQISSWWEFDLQYDKRSGYKIVFGSHHNLPKSTFIHLTLIYPSRPTITRIISIFALHSKLFNTMMEQRNDQKNTVHVILHIKSSVYLMEKVT